MDEQALTALLAQFRKGELDESGVIERLKVLPFEDLGFAMVDHHRALRQGVPEVIFCPGKAPEHISAIAEKLLGREGAALLATRASQEAFDAIRLVAPDAVYHPLARIVTVRRQPALPLPGRLAVVSAGTADFPVAEEAALVAEELGCQTRRLYDVGVAGLHRLLSRMEELRGADVLIVVAGMEGALASVLGGLVEAPLIAVPTSVGYGASFGGLAALLAMLNSCASGVGVCNIDNGFGAAMMAARILKMKKR